MMRERFIPRIMEAPADALIDATGNNLDPHKIWTAMFRNEKPGGHGERSVAIGTIDMAIWDAVAKIEGKPLFQLLSDRYGERQARPEDLRLRRRRLLLPRPGLQEAAGRDAQLPRPRLHGREEEDRRRERSTRTCAASTRSWRCCRTARSCAWTPTAASICETRPSPTPRRCRSTTCSGTRSRATRWTSSCRPRCATTTPTRWPPAKTCSRCRTRATSSATAACARTGTGCSSTAR